MGLPLEQEVEYQITQYLTNQGLWTYGSKNVPINHLLTYYHLPEFRESHTKEFEDALYLGLLHEIQNKEQLTHATICDMKNHGPTDHKSFEI